MVRGSHIMYNVYGYIYITASIRHKVTKRTCIYIDILLINRCISGLSAESQLHHPVTIITIILPKNAKLRQQGNCNDSGVRTTHSYSYECPPQIKYVKRIINV